nr:hypothetical protein Iba_chr04fCG11230 [Ipomoea batatas]
MEDVIFSNVDDGVKKKVGVEKEMNNDKEDEVVLEKEVEEKKVEKEKMSEEEMKKEEVTIPLVEGSNPYGGVGNSGKILAQYVGDDGGTVRQQQLESDEPTRSPASSSYSLTVADSNTIPEPSFRLSSVFTPCPSWRESSKRSLARQPPNATNTGDVRPEINADKADLYDRS